MVWRLWIVGNRDKCICPDWIMDPVNQGANRDSYSGNLSSVWRKNNPFDG